MNNRNEKLKFNNNNLLYELILIPFLSNFDSNINSLHKKGLIMIRIKEYYELPVFLSKVHSIK